MQEPEHRHGRFISWKFLPIIGQYVVQLLDGELEESLVRRWAWDRSEEDGVQDKIKPRRELKDLM